ncbi:type II toxin-antitoxin system VapC family toxin [Hydrogenophilus islandicus]
MILLDTNVISEPLRAQPDARVVAWLDAQPLETLFLSVVTVAELRFGVARLPVGRRRNSLIEQLECQIFPAFAGRILPFDVAATQPYAEALANAQASGLAVGMADGFIAATALANRLTVATRDTSPFVAMGVPVINPWLESPNASA